MSRLGNLKGLVGLVTGGGSGLGRATAERFVQQGARVVIADLPSSQGERVSKKLGDDCVFIPTDVVSESEVQAAINTAKVKYGQLNLAVNCAGTYSQQSTYSQRRDRLHSLVEFQRILQVNTVGTFNVMRLAAQAMSQNEANADGQRGVIINTASIAGYEGSSGTAAYAASKGAIIAMTLPVARDLAKVGVRVVTLAPGPFDTHMLKNDVPDIIINQMEKEAPFPNRLGNPDEFAHMVQMVVENPMLNGGVIRIDGATRLRDVWNYKMSPMRIFMPL